MLLQSKEKLQEIIVRLLAGKPNLSALVIHQKVNKSIYSLQSVYKSLKKLQEGGVVVKIKQSYSLRLPWVFDFISLAGKVSKTYLSPSLLISVLPLQNKKKIWHFDNLLKLNDFWGHLLLLLVKKSPTKVLLGWNPHPWFHLVQTKQEKQYIKSLGLAKGKLYLIVGGDTDLDKWAEKFFDKKIVEYSFGKKVFTKDPSVYFNVIDDFLLTVKLDAKTARAIENLYKKTKSVDELDLAAVLKLFQAKVKATIWLEKNPKRAKIFKRRFSRFFGLKF